MLALRSNTDYSGNCKQNEGKILMCNITRILQESHCIQESCKNWTFLQETCKILQEIIFLLTRDEIEYIYFVGVVR